MSSLLWDNDASILTFEVTKAERNESESKVTKFPVERGFNITDHVRPDPSIPGLTVLVSNTPLHGGVPQQVDLIYPVRQRSTEPLKVTAEKYDQPPGLNPGAVAIKAIEKVGSLIFGDDGPEYTVSASKYDNRPVNVTYAGRRMDVSKQDRRIDLLETLERLRDEKTALKVVTLLAVYPNCILQSIKFDRSKSGSGLTLDLEFSKLNIVDTKLVPAPQIRVKRATVKAPKGDAGEAKDLTKEQRKAALRKIAQSLLGS